MLMFSYKIIHNQAILVHQSLFRRSGVSGGGIYRQHDRAQSPTRSLQKGYVPITVTVTVTVRTVTVTVTVTTAPTTAAAAAAAAAAEDVAKSYTTSPSNR